jgi:hypothetical protein
MERGTEVNDVPTAMLDDEETVQQPKRGRRHGEEIHRSDFAFVVPQEGNPSLHLVGLGWAPRYVARHRHLGHDEPEFRELCVDTRSAPAVLSHCPDEIANLCLDSRAP